MLLTNVVMGQKVSCERTLLMLPCTDGAKRKRAKRATITCHETDPLSLSAKITHRRNKRNNDISLVYDMLDVAPISVFNDHSLFVKSRCFREELTYECRVIHSSSV
jgi:hypothetical protein